MPGALVLQWHRLVGVQLAGQLAGRYPPLGREQQELRLVEHRRVPGVVPLEAYCWTYLLVAWTKTVCRLVAAVAAVSPAMSVASGSTAVAGSVGEAGTVAADSAGTDWAPHSIDWVFRELLEDQLGHRVGR